MKKKGENIYSIYLRRPKTKSDSRDDPFYDRGDFGSTGCHSKNILNPRYKNKFKEGNAKLCFMQGGSENTKIVYITPSLSKVIEKKDILILKWDSKWNEQNKHPLKYKYGLPLTNILARKLNKNVKKEKKEKEVYQHFRTITKPICHPNFLLTEYKRYINKMKEKYGNEIFIKNNYETFEYKNVLSSSSRCKFKN